MFSASLRTGSLNQRLATLAARRLRALGAALRQMLELGLAASVLPAMISVPQAHEAFDGAGDLLHQRTGGMLDQLLGELVGASRLRVPA